MIPSDIIVEILYRLPAKSIGQFRCVSKDWLSLLTDPAFIRTHQNTLNRNHFIFTSGSFLYSHPFHHHEPVLTPTKLPIELGDSIDFHGSCDGLVLVSSGNMGRFDTLVLLNPTTRESVQLPQSGYYHHEKSETTHGVGYDSVTDDYKVITLAYFNTCTRVSLYSLRNNTWRRRRLRLIDCPYECDSWVPAVPAVYVNGFLHWVGNKKDNFESSVIVAFSLADECFSEVPAPNLCNDTDIMSMASDYCCKLVVLGGKLAIHREFEVWLMNEYGVKESWTKIPLDRFDEILMANPMICYDNGKIRVASYDKMLIYDFEKRTFRKNVYVWNPKRFRLEGTYVESLVSPKIDVYN